MALSSGVIGESRPVFVTGKLILPGVESLPILGLRDVEPEPHLMKFGILGVLISKRFISQNVQRESISA